MRPARTSQQLLASHILHPKLKPRSHLPTTAALSPVKAPLEAQLLALDLLIECTIRTPPQDPRNADA